MDKRRDIWIGQGLCNRCGGQRDEGYKTCAPCRTKMTKYMRQWKNRHRISGTNLSKYILSPKSILKLADDIEQARKRLEVLEKQWDDIFGDKPNNSEQAGVTDGNRP